MALSAEQKRILAQTILGEAGGEGYEGMLAVAHVLKNRVESERFPGDPVSVALQPAQFSTWNRGEGGNNPGRFGPGSQGYEQAIRAIEAAFDGSAPDPTGGATHYWSPRGMPGRRDPYWAKSEQGEAGRIEIGNHVFLPQQAPQSALSAANALAGAPPQRPETLSGYASPQGPVDAPPQAPMPPLPRSDPRVPLPWPEMPQSEAGRDALFQLGLDPMGSEPSTPAGLAERLASTIYDPSSDLAPFASIYEQHQPLPNVPGGPSTRQALGPAAPNIPSTPGQRGGRVATQMVPVGPSLPQPGRPQTETADIPIPRLIGDPIPFPYPSGLEQDRGLQIALAGQGYDVPGANVPPPFVTPSAPIAPVTVADLPPLPQQVVPRTNVAQLPGLPPQRPVPAPQERVAAVTPPMPPMPPQRPPMATLAPAEVATNPVEQAGQFLGDFSNNGGLWGMGLNALAGRGLFPGDEGVIPQFKAGVADRVAQGADPISAVFSRRSGMPPMFTPSAPGGYASPVQAVNRSGSRSGFLSVPNRSGPSSFDQQYHSGQNMDIARANSRALGGAITQKKIDDYLASGGTLYKAG